MKIKRFFKRNADLAWVDYRQELRAYNNYSESDKKISMIICMDCENGISKNNGIPWEQTTEFIKLFKRLTFGKTVIMGSNTWDLLAQKPLSGRQNIVISKNPRKGYESLHQAIYNANHDIFIIGGRKLYNEVLNYDIADEIHLTKLYSSYDCDQFIKIPFHYKPVYEKESETSTYILLKK